MVELDRVRFIRTVLVSKARSRKCVTYKRIGDLLGLAPRARTLHKLLEEVDRREHEAGRPMLTALVLKQLRGIAGVRDFEGIQLVQQP